MLLLILGAGASYDAVPAYAPGIRDHESRLPVTNDLFDLKYAAELSNFRRAAPIVPLLRDIPGGSSLEAVLEQLHEEAAEDEERERQLMAVRYYLHYVIGNHDQDWYSVSTGATNHAALLDEIRRLLPPYRDILIVTFNYDRLVERSLQDMGAARMDTMEDYVSGRFKLFKLHGSVDWGRGVAELRAPPRSDLSGWERVQHIIQTARHTKLGNRYQKVEELPIWGAEGMWLVPAIAIPLQRKQDFELPGQHLDLLRQSLPNVQALISVGWRATDTPFLDLLREHMKQHVRGFVVTGTRPEETISRFLAAGLDVDLSPHAEGFSSFVKSREVRRLAESPT